MQCEEGQLRPAGAHDLFFMLQVPDVILHNKALNDAIAILPANYNFEVRSPAGPAGHQETGNHTDA